MAEKSLEAHLYECLMRGNTERGDTKRALYIIELLGDDVNKLYRGKSPLLWAKEFNNDEVVKALEEKGAVEKEISEEEAERLGKELVEKSFNYIYNINFFRCSVSVAKSQKRITLKSS